MRALATAVPCCLLLTCPLVGPTLGNFVNNVVDIVREILS